MGSQAKHRPTTSPADPASRLCEPADGELVRRVVQGDSAAFDLLVLRHRSKVLSAARSVVRDRDRAEDAAQQALLEAYRGLRGLSDAERFLPWLTVITKRCAARLLSTALAQPVPVEYSEAVMCPLAASESPQDHQMRERIASSLARLSARDRDVVTLHYLDGYSCREVGERLGIPTGTVKRILHESRNSLRSTLGITPRATKGALKMDLTTKANTAEPGPRRLVWWINGDYPGSRMYALMAQSIALAANKTPLSLEELARAVDANPEYVREPLDALVAEDLVRKTRDDRYITGFVALSADDWIEVTKDVRRHAAVLADALLDHLPGLQKAWEGSPKPAQGFPWSDGIWPTLAVFVCNVGISRLGPPEPELSVHPDSGKAYAPGGREVVPDEHVMWSTGFNSYYPRITDFGYGYGYGYFWSHGMARSTVGYSEDAIKVLNAGVAGVWEPEAVADRTGIPVERVRELLAQVIEWGMVRRQGDALEFTIPIFREEDDKALAPTVDEVAARVSDDIIAPATESVSDALRRLGYGHAEDNFPSWRRWLEGNIAGEALRELLRRGVLPDPGSPAPSTFCLIGWMGNPQLRLMQWRQ